MNNNKKHIIFCSTSYYEYDRRIQRIINVLVENNYSVSWISRYYNIESKVLLNVNHQKIKPYFKSGILFYLEMNMRFLIKLLFSKANIICSIDNDTIVPSYYASKLTGKKIIFDAHEIFHEVPELLNKPFKKKIWKSISKIYYPKIKSKYTVNQSLKKVFKEEFGTEFEIIRNVPPLSNDQFSLPQRSNKTLVYLGVLNKGRGIEIAIRSLAILQDYKLKLIGDGDISNELKQLTKELNLESRVEFLGYLNPVDIHNQLINSSIGLNMLIPESENYKLSLANKFFDYMHAALPSINMDYPEYRTINESYDVAILVNAYSSKKLISAINLIEEQEIYNHLQQNCIKAKKVFNWDIESKKLIKIFNNLN